MILTTIPLHSLSCVITNAILKYDSLGDLPTLYTLDTEDSLYFAAVTVVVVSSASPAILAVMKQ